jgi:hypothetical protein
MSKTKEDNLHSIGKCAMASIREMVDALECDYDRLTDLRDERDSYEPSDGEERLTQTECATNAEQWAFDNSEEAEELAALEADAGECTDREDAEQRIHDDPMSLEYRSGWCASKEEMEPEEFVLLLTTGGPAVRIIGEVSDGEPDRPRLQTQDWGTSWTDYFGGEDHSDDCEALLTYCRCFCMES